MELIDKQAAIDAFYKYPNVNWTTLDVMNKINAVPSAQFATDTNVGTKLGTNLAEVGTDCISRQAVMLRVREFIGNPSYTEKMLVDELNGLPSAQPEIIRCKDCKYAEYIDDVQTLWCTECGQGRTVAPDDFCSYAERREVTE